MIAWLLKERIEHGGRLVSRAGRSRIAGWKHVTRLAVFFVIAVFYSACLAGSYSVQNPSIYNPAGISTVPQSSIRSGLVSNPNPIDNSGNLIVTGNVRRGSHFRGDIPYQSTTSFSANLGTSSLSSFLRDSAGSQDYGIYSDSYRVQPYFSPEETVTTTAPGQAGVLRPANTRIDGRADMSGTGTFQSDVSTGTDVFGLEISSAGVTAGEKSNIDLSPQSLGIQYSSPTEPQSMPTRTDLSEQVLSDYTGRSEPIDTVMNAPDSIRKMQLLQQERIDAVQSTESDKLNKTDGVTVPGAEHGVFDMQIPGIKPEQDASVNVNNMQPDLEENPTVTIPDDTNRKESTLPLRDDNFPVPEAAQDLSATGLETSESGDSVEFITNQSSESSTDMRYEQLLAADKKRRDSLERIRRQLEDLTRSIGDTSTRPAMHQSTTTESITDMGLHRQDNVDRRESRQSDQQRTMTDSNQGIEVEPVMGEVEGTPSIRRSADGMRFNEHFQNGQFSMTAGRYYEASKSFELALLYEPDNPSYLAGKAHALFAAGEYVSSALFLSRALEVNPAYAQTEVNLADVLGGTKRTEERISDLEQWLSISDSHQLKFLLSYICYRTGKLDKAKLAIDIIWQKTPQSKSVRVLKAAIDQKLTTQ